MPLVVIRYLVALGHCTDRRPIPLAIQEHPPIGSILMCRFDEGFQAPEMVKTRPVIIISPKISARPGLCTVVALSMTAPQTIMQYHCQLNFQPPLPAPLASSGVWVKVDMVISVALRRLDFIRLGKDQGGKRIYYYDTIQSADLARVRAAVLHGLGMSALTKHL